MLLTEKSITVTMPRAAGSYELWSLLALIAIIYLGNKFVMIKSLYFSLLCSSKERKWPEGEDGIHWYVIRRNKRLKFTRI